MNEFAPEGQQAEPQRSKVKVTMNAKHEAQWEISAVEGATSAELQRLKTIAVNVHNELIAELIHGNAKAAA